MTTCRTIEHCFHRITRDIQAFGWVFIERSDTYFAYFAALYDSPNKTSRLLPFTPVQSRAVPRADSCGLVHSPVQSRAVTFLFRFVFFRFVSFGYFDMPVAPILKPTGTIDTPCYKAVPKDFEAHLEYRRNLLEEAANSREAQKNIWLAC